MREGGGRRNRAREIRRESLGNHALSAEGRSSRRRGGVCVTGKETEGEERTGKAKKQKPQPRKERNTERAKDSKGRRKRKSGKKRTGRQSPPPRKAQEE
ncbi:unnamed protein product [Prunus armeniaca]|uniref:Uncharacterized protein n=1 Tax=Prunus armeniaca TaxID=36596 RepID=A0A6J5WRU5_PRUAR|nr:unnamed protein product [Prunus armeniaca]